MKIPYLAQYFEKNPFIFSQSQISHQNSTTFFTETKEDSDPDEFINCSMGTEKTAAKEDSDPDEFYF